MEEQIWARSVISDKAKIVKNRVREGDCMRSLNWWFTHLAAFNVSSLIEKHFFPLPDVSSPPTLFTSTSLPCSSPVINCSRLFQSPGNNQWVSWINFLPSLFPFSLLLSSLYHPTQLFPICPGLPAVHLVKEWTANQGDAHQHQHTVFSIVCFCVSSPSCFGLLNLHQVTLPLNLSLSPFFPLSLSLVISLPEDFTSLLLLSEKPLCLFLRGGCYRQPVEEEEKEWGWRVMSNIHYSLENLSQM